MRAIIAGFFAFVVTALFFAHHPGAFAQDKTNVAAATQIDYQGFEGLTREVERYRAERLVSLADFQRMARESNTIILDARSAQVAYFCCRPQMIVCALRSSTLQRRCIVSSSSSSFSSTSPDDSAMSAASTYAFIPIAGVENSPSAATDSLRLL